MLRIRLGLGSATAVRAATKPKSAWEDDEDEVRHLLRAAAAAARGAPDSEYELYQNALSQLELADALGYDYAWEVEHHFLEEYSHSSAPEVFLSAASQRTKRIRLGHGIFQLTTNHPAKVAEKVAALDLISNGRVELGMGESASITELTPFNVRFDEKRAIFEDAVRCLVPMFGDGGVEYHGQYFDFPLRNVLPKPRQKPHPPLWTACSQLPTIAYAGEKGIGALGFQFVSADAAHAWVHAYYNGMTRRLAKLADYPVNPNIALVSMFMCAPHRRGSARQGRRRDLLPVLPALLQQRRPLAPAARRGQHVGRVREVEGRQPPSRPSGRSRAG